MWDKETLSMTVEKLEVITLWNESIEKINCPIILGIYTYVRYLICWGENQEFIEIEKIMEKFNLDKEIVKKALLVLVELNILRLSHA